MTKTSNVILAVLLALGAAAPTRAAGRSGSARAAPAGAAERVKVKVERYDPYGGQRSFINLVCYRLMQEVLDSLRQSREIRPEMCAFVLTR